MPLQLSKFKYLLLLFVILQACHYNFTILRNTLLLTPSICLLKFIDQNTPNLFLPLIPSLLSLHGVLLLLCHARHLHAAATAALRRAPLRRHLLPPLPRPPPHYHHGAVTVLVALPPALAGFLEPRGTRSASAPHLRFTWMLLARSDPAGTSSATSFPLHRPPKID